MLIDTFTNIICFTYSFFYFELPVILIVDSAIMELDTSIVHIKSCIILDASDIQTFSETWENERIENTQWAIT